MAIPQPNFAVRLALLAVVAGGCAGPSAAPGPAGGAPPTSAQAGGQTIVAIAPPSQPPPSLPQFLGVNDLFTGGHALDKKKHALLSRLFPQLANAMSFLDPVPPLLAVTDPANLGPDAPAVAQAAAEVQAEEDAAPQKIKAIEALARVGCVKGRPKVEEGLLAALDDPTESVRFAAVKAIRDLGGSPCTTCKGNDCCTPEVYKKLDRIAHRLKGPGCYEEPSARIRRMAALALENCGAPPPGPAPPEPIEGPPQPEPDSPPDIEGPPLPMPEGPEPSRSARKTRATKSSDAETSLVKTSSAKSTPSADVEPPIPDLAPQQPEISPPTPDVVQSGGEVPENGPAVQTVVHKSESGESSAVVSADSIEPPESPETRDGRATPAQPPTEGAVRWESVTARFEQFRTRRDAWASIAYFRKRALKIHSRPPAGFDQQKLTVRTHGWTQPHEAESDPLQQALQSLPIGRVSSVIENREGYHLVRLLERHQAEGVARSKPDQPQQNQTPAAELPVREAVRRPEPTSKFTPKTPTGRSSEQSTREPGDFGDSIRRTAGESPVKPFPEDAARDLPSDERRDAEPVHPSFEQPSDRRTDRQSESPSDFFDDDAAEDRFRPIEADEDFGPQQSKREPVQTSPPISNRKPWTLDDEPQSAVQESRTPQASRPLTPRPPVQPVDAIEEPFAPLPFHEVDRTTPPASRRNEPRRDESRTQATRSESDRSEPTHAETMGREAIRTEPSRRETAASNRYFLRRNVADLERGSNDEPRKSRDDRPKVAHNPPGERPASRRSVQNGAFEEPAERPAPPKATVQHAGARRDGERRSGVRQVGFESVNRGSATVAPAVPRSFDPDPGMLEPPPRSDKHETKHSSERRRPAANDDGELDWGHGYRVLKQRKASQNPKSAEPAAQQEGDDLFNDGGIGSWNNGRSGK